QAEDGIRDKLVTGVQTCALPIYGIAGFTLHRELELYVRAGLSPAQALQIATWNGARFTGRLAELGSIELRKRADLILVDGDPTRSEERRVGERVKISVDDESVKK